MYASLITTALHAKHTLVVVAAVKRLICINYEAQSICSLRAAGDADAALRLHSKANKRQTVPRQTDLQARLVLQSSLQRHVK